MVFEGRWLSTMPVILELHLSRFFLNSFVHQTLFMKLSISFTFYSKILWKSLWKSLLEVSNTLFYCQWIIKLGRLNYIRKSCVVRENTYHSIIIKIRPDENFVKYKIGVCLHRHAPIFLKSIILLFAWTIFLSMWLKYLIFEVHPVFLSLFQRFRIIWHFWLDSKVSNFIRISVRISRGKASIAN